MNVRLLCAALVAGTAGLGLVPMAAAASPGAAAVPPGAAAPTPSTSRPTVESWYQPNASCSSPTGCVVPGAPPAGLPVPAAPAPAPTDPFPPGSLHVGASGGQETARTYLGVDRRMLAAGVRRASLLVPLDVERSDGSMAPETAKVQVCLTTARLTKVEGSLAEPPAADCAQAAAVKVLSVPAPHLEADLTALLDGREDATGLVLLPDATAISPADSFRLVFSARSRTDARKTVPASLTVVPAAAPAKAPAGSAPVPARDTVGSQPQAPTAAGPAEAPAAVAQAGPEPGGGPAAVAQAPAPGPVAQAPQTATDLPAAAAPVALAQTVTVGYAYPVVWLLPLALLVVVPLIARALTRDLTPTVPAAADG